MAHTVAYMRDWRVWQGSTQILSDVQYANINARVSSMWDYDLSLSDPDFTKTWLEHGSAIRIYEGGNSTTLDNLGVGSSDGNTIFTSGVGFWQSRYIQLAIDVVDADMTGSQISYTRLASYNCTTGVVTFNVGSTVGAGSTLLANYVYSGTCLFKGEIEKVEVNTEKYNDKIVNLTGRDDLLDASYKSLIGGTYRMGWTDVSDEDLGDGDGATTIFSLANGSVAEDSLILTVGSTVGGVETGTAYVSASRVYNTIYQSGTITFFDGNTIANGSTLMADYTYAGGSTVELMVKKVCDAVGYSYDNTTIPVTGVTSVCDVRNLTGYDGFLKLKEICGSAYVAEFWKDPEDELFYFRDAESGGTSFTRDVIKKHTYTEDATDNYDEVKYHYQNDKQTITKGSGTKTLHLFDPKCKYKQEADEKAKYIYEINSQTKVMGNITPDGWSTSEKLGDIIRITESAIGQTAGSYIIKGIMRHWSIGYRLGEVTYEYGSKPLQWSNVFKQMRDVSDYREMELDREKKYTQATDLTHNVLSGLQGGSSGEYYHLKVSDYNNVTGTQKMVKWFSAGNYALDPRTLDWWTWTGWQYSIFNFVVPEDYDSGSFHIEGLNILSGGAGTAVIQIGEEHIEYSGGTASDYGGATSMGTYITGASFHTDYGTSDFYYFHDWGDVGTYSVSPGDIIRVRVMRLTADGSDSAGNTWRCAGVRVSYTGKISH